jgi:hypothetical protein
VPVAVAAEESAGMCVAHTVVRYLNASARIAVEDSRLVAARLINT